MRRLIAAPRRAVDCLTVRMAPHQDHSSMDGSTQMHAHILGWQYQPGCATLLVQAYQTLPAPTWILPLQCFCKCLPVLLRQGICVQIRGIPPSLYTGLAGKQLRDAFPPALFVHMTRDARTAATVVQDISALKAEVKSAISAV